MKTGLGTGNTPSPENMYIIMAGMELFVKRIMVMCLTITKHNPGSFSIPVNAETMCRVIKASVNDEYITKVFQTVEKIIDRRTEINEEDIAEFGQISQDLYRCISESNHEAVQQSMGSTSTMSSYIIGKSLADVCAHIDDDGDDSSIPPGYQDDVPSHEEPCTNNNDLEKDRGENGTLPHKEEDDVVYGNDSEKREEPDWCLRDTDGLSKKRRRSVDNNNIIKKQRSGIICSCGICTLLTDDIPQTSNPFLQSAVNRLLQSI